MDERLGLAELEPGVGRAELDGPVTEGATGTVRAVGGPTSTLKVVAIEPGRHLVTEASERLMRLRFEVWLADAAGGQMRITHRVRMTGPATPLMRHTVGARLKRSIPAALAALVQHATTGRRPSAASERSPLASPLSGAIRTGTSGARAREASCAYSPSHFRST